jgi:hypothetical protein
MLLVRYSNNKNARSNAVFCFAIRDSRYESRLDDGSGTGSCPALDISFAFPAQEGFSKVRGAALLGSNPRADSPRGIVAQVLAVAALEIGDPIAEIVLVESYDLALG